MNAKEFSRLDDLNTSFTEHIKYDHTSILGTWYNCDADSRQIIKLDLIEDDGELFINAYGTCHPDPCDWGSVKVKPFIALPDTNVVGGFTCLYDFGYMETQICSNVKRGILVIQAYNIFKDNSGRPNYFSREFFNQ